MRDLLAAAFVGLWGAAGWVAGTFFYRVRQLQIPKKDSGKMSLESARIVTLLIFLAIVILASEIGSRAEVPSFAKTGALVVCLVCCVLGYRRPWQ